MLTPPPQPLDQGRVRQVLVRHLGAPFVSTRVRGWTTAIEYDFGGANSPAQWVYEADLETFDWRADFVVELASKIDPEVEARRARDEQIASLLARLEQLERRVPAVEESAPTKRRAGGRPSTSDDDLLKMLHLRDHCFAPYTNVEIAYLVLGDDIDQYNAVESTISHRLRKARQRYPDGSPCRYCDSSWEPTRPHMPHVHLG